MSVSLRTACFRVVVVSSLFWGSLFLALYWQRVHQMERSNDPRWTIRRIASRPLTQDRLPLAVLSELLYLQRDQTVSLFLYHPQRVARLLRSCPAIERARVWRLLPGTLGVEYALRKPLAILAGVKNVAVDTTGTPFFLFPFYPPKRLPTIVLPIGTPRSLSDLQRSLLSTTEAPLGLQLVRELSTIGEREHLFLDLIDVSQMNHGNIFRREVVIAFTSISRNEKLYIRMDPRSLFQTIGVVPKILHSCLKDGFRPGTIDMRFGEYAIVSKNLV